MTSLSQNGCADTHLTAPIALVRKVAEMLPPGALPPRPAVASYARHAVTGFLVLFLATVAQAIAEAQECPALTTVVPGHDITILVKKADDACTVQSGGYVKTGNLNRYKLHIQASITGQCQPRMWSSGQCVNVGPVQTRHIGWTGAYINGVHEDDFTTTSGKTASDSTIPQDTQPGKYWGTLTVGTYEYTSFTHTSLTECDFLDAGAADNEPVVMHALQCAPTWEQDSNQNYVKLQNTTLEIYTAISSTQLADAIDAAASAWTSPGVGPTVVRTTTDCGTGPTCIRIVEENIGSLCASNTYSTDANGQIDGDAVIKLNPDWDTYGSHLRRLIAHAWTHAGPR